MLTESDKANAACEWSDYRKVYGVSASALTETHRAFLAGYEAARGMSHEPGALR